MATLAYLPVWGAVPAVREPELAAGWLEFPCILAVASARISAALVKLKLDATEAPPTEVAGGACAPESRHQSHSHSSQ